MKKRIFSIFFLILSSITLFCEDEKKEITILDLIPFNPDSINTFFDQNIGTKAQKLLSTSNDATGIMITYHIPIQKKISQDELVYELTRFTSLKGIKYYSRSRKRERILFYNIYQIDSKNYDTRFFYKNKPLEDPLFSDKTSPLLTWTLYQNDSTFNESIWEISLDKGSSKIILSFENKTSLKKIGIPIAQPSGMKMIFVIIQDETSLQLKAAISAEITPMPLFEDIIKASLTNRLNAISIAILRNITNIEYPLPHIDNIIK